jgi:hypothetical protein
MSGEMDYVCYVAASLPYCQRVGHVTFEYAQTRVLEVASEKLQAASTEVVEDYNVAQAAIENCVDEMTADEAGAAGN